MHELLPWYANDTLGPDERVAFEEHLGDCAECRTELELIEEMRKKLREAGPAALSDHPAPEVLLATVRPEQADIELDAETARQVRQHLALCLTCADEAEWLTGDAVAAAAGESEEEEPDRLPDASRSIVARQQRGPVLPWVGLAAAVLVIAVLVPFALRDSAPSSSQVGSGVVRSVRSILEPVTIEVPASLDEVVLTFEADMGPESYPARLQIEPGPDGGDPILSMEIVGPPSASFGVSCSRDLCTDGEYVARLTRAGDEPALEYRFRLRTARRP